MSDWRPPSPSRGPDDHGEVPEGIDPVSGVPYSEGWRDRTVVESVRASLGLLTKREHKIAAQIEEKIIQRGWVA